MLWGPDGVEAHVFGGAHAIKLFSDYLVLGLAACGMFEEVQYSEFHRSLSLPAA
jgi:hypothetical protein